MDGYAGFNGLYRSRKVNEVACMAHVRRKFVDIFKASGLAIAEEAVRHRPAEVPPPAGSRHHRHGHENDLDPIKT